MVVCFTGGGTLGHVYPALAVHQELSSSESYSGFWIGRNDPTERRIVEEANLDFYSIPSGKLRRYPSLRTVTDGFKVLGAIGFAYRILKRRKPDLLFSKGGFVSVPPVIAAHLLKIPVISHESDISPGLATRINARFSDLICVPFAEGFDRLGREKLRVTGNPVRKDLLEAKQKPFALAQDALPLLLVLGGSGGSAAINALIEKTLDELLSICSVYHQVGKCPSAFAPAQLYRRRVHRGRACRVASSGGSRGQPKRGGGVGGAEAVCKGEHPASARKKNKQRRAGSECPPSGSEGSGRGTL